MAQRTGGDFELSYEADGENLIVNDTRRIMLVSECFGMQCLKSSVTKSRIRYNYLNGWLAKRRHANLSTV